MQYKGADVERFLDKVFPEPMSGCWLWEATTTWFGYGQFRLNGSMQKAHRVSYVMFVGPPGTYYVLHKCNNPSCVNPNHLYLGKQKDNMEDRQKSGTWSSKWGKSPISDNDIEEFKRLATEGYSQKQIGQMTGWSQQTISLHLKH